MRIRSVKPEFWEDAGVASLPIGARLFFIGLWNLADDGGYLRWSVFEVAAALYRYETRSRRERSVAESMVQLEAGGLAAILPCGKHALVPNLPKHQRLAGEAKQVHTFEREHEACTAHSRNGPHIPAETRGPPATPRTSPPSRARAGRSKGEGSSTKKEGDGRSSPKPPSLPDGGTSLPDDAVLLTDDPKRPDLVALRKRGMTYIRQRELEILDHIADNERRTERDVLSGYQVVASWIAEAPKGGHLVDFVMQRENDLKRERGASADEIEAAWEAIKEADDQSAPEQLGAILQRVTPEAAGG